MQRLAALLQRHETWLMERILHYAKTHDYAKYTSTLVEAWRLSISGLTDSILKGIEHYRESAELHPDDTFQDNPVAEFGIVEAQRHRERGISFTMFLGLFKYYRQAYLDLLKEYLEEDAERDHFGVFLNRIFDRIEIAFCEEWTQLSDRELIQKLQSTNRFMTNEKNMYLTAFESQNNPVVLLDSAWCIVNINFEAARLVSPTVSPGSSYYSIENGRTDDDLKTEADVIQGNKAILGKRFEDVFPWLGEIVQKAKCEDKKEATFEIEFNQFGELRFFEGKLCKMLDVSEKFNGILLILEDRTEARDLSNERECLIADLQKNIREIKRLQGMLPICVSCKKIRDDKGYWNQIENYISSRSEVDFSHSLCPECTQELYGDFLKEK